MALLFQNVAVPSGCTLPSRTWKASRPTLLAPGLPSCLADDLQPDRSTQSPLIVGLIVMGLVVQDPGPGGGAIGQVDQADREDDPMPLADPKAVVAIQDDVAAGPRLQGIPTAMLADIGLQYL